MKATDKNLTKYAKIKIAMDPLIIRPTFIPKYENAYKGATLHLVDGIRGKHEGSLGMMWIFDSNEARNLYFEENGQPTKLNQEIGESLNGVNQGLSKLGNWTSQYTDWEIN